MRAYSMDLRQRVLADSDDGMKTRAVAAKYRVSEAWVRHLKQRRTATRETAPPLSPQPPRQFPQALRRRTPSGRGRGSRPHPGRTSQTPGRAGQHRHVVAGMNRPETVVEKSRSTRQNRTARM